MSNHGQCTVVFALIVREQASECVAGSVTIYAKTTEHCSPDSSISPTISLTFVDPVRNATEDDPLLPIPTEEQGLAGARQPVSQAGQSHS
jgi:hypothetical protein